MLYLCTASRTLGWVPTEWEHHGGKAMRAARVKNVPFFYFLTFPLSFSDAVMFNLKTLLLWKQKTVNRTS